MKKIYLVAAIFTGISALFLLEPEWFRFLWGWQILLLPIIAGISLVLVQQTDKSLPVVCKLLIGSIIIGFSFSILMVIIDHLKYNQSYNIVPLEFALNIINFSLFVAFVCIFGGLIGIVIKGLYPLLIKIKK